MGPLGGLAIPKRSQFVHGVSSQSRHRTRHLRNRENVVPMNWRISIRDGLIYSAVFAFTLLASWGAYKLPLAHGEVMAAWFQGFGTISAVVFALAIQIRNENNAKIAEVERRAQLLKDVTALVGASRDAVAVARNALERSDIEAYGAAFSTIDGLVAEFQKWADLPIKDWWFPSLAIALDRVGRALRSITSSAGDLCGLRTGLPDKLRSFDWYVDILNAQLKAFGDVAELAAKRLV